MCGHSLQQAGRAGDVVLVVAQRLGGGLADGFERGEVENRVEAVGGERPIEAGRIPNVAFHERNVSAREIPDGFDRGTGPVREVVEHDDVVSSGDQFDGGVAADVARAAGDEDLHASCAPGPGRGRARNVLRP